jgi:hypothetical protein
MSSSVESASPVRIVGLIKQYSGTSVYVLNPFQILGLIPNKFFP